MSVMCRIVDAANISYPISIIIIGIGNAQFGFMETLDADKVSLKNSKGEKMKRDIVQFIKFNKYKQSGDIHNLTNAALKEIPKQFMTYVLQNQSSIPLKTRQLNINPVVTGNHFN